MDKFGHNMGFVITWIILLIWRIIIQDIKWYIFGGFWLAYKIANPDDDFDITKFIIKRIEKIKGKKKEQNLLKGKKNKFNIVNVGLHRWFFTHSILYPIFIYEVGKYYFNNNVVKEFGFLMFLSVTIHLLLDFRIKHLIEDTSKGNWRIALFPINYILYYVIVIFTLGMFKPIKIKKFTRLGKYGSYFWMILNVVITTCYTIWVFGIWIF